MEVRVGIISHVYKKIGVAIVDLSDTLQVGDTIHITGHHTDLTQRVESIQIEHQNIQKAERGQSIGLKVNGQVREHDIVFKLVN
ncbi:MAG: translation elongation factor-like protein [Thermodesulfovibrionales bacterium]